MREIGEVICAALAPATTTPAARSCPERTRALMERYPLYAELAAAV